MYIEMNSDIREYEPKILAFFTTRQILCIVISLAYGVPVAFLVPLSIGFRITIAAVLMAPVLICGWVRVYGMPLEAFMIRCVLPMVIRPQKRAYETKNQLEYLRDKDEQPRKIKRSKNIRGMK